MIHTSCELPRGVEREYLQVFGVAAICVVTLPQQGEPCEVFVTRDLERSFQVWRRRWLCSEIVAAFWVRDRATAAMVVKLVDQRLPHDDTGRLAVPVDRVMAEIAMVARDNSTIRMTAHEVVMLRIRTATDRVDDVLRAANGTGDLAWFNRAFKNYRAQGGRMFYAEARARLRRAITKRLLVSDRLGGLADGGRGVLLEVFASFPPENAS